jgi:multidrug efflux pump subunit AcrA (membrane-fusion protein)
VTSGATLGSIITKEEIADISLNEIDITKIAVGQKATLTFDAIAGLTVDGTIAEIDTLSTTSSGVVTYTVKVAFDNTDPRIKPGMTVSADVLLQQKDNVIAVPNDAIKTVRGKSMVTIQDLASGATATKQVEVTTGISNDSQTEILSGLNEGDVVIITRKISAAGATATTPSLLGSGGGTGRGFGGGGGTRAGQ